MPVVVTVTVWDFVSPGLTFSRPGALWAQPAGIVMVSGKAPAAFPTFLSVRLNVVAPPGAANRAWTGALSQAYGLAGATKVAPALALRAISVALTLTVKG